jgi:replicative DNA helicase
MEMGASQLALRMVGSQGRIDQQHLRTGRLDNDEWGRLTEAVEKLSKSAIFIDETPALSVAELRARARRQARQCGKLGLIVIDYLQLMSGSSSDGENRATEIGEISRGLKGLAKELQCPVIALSQLNRSVETRNDKRPDDERPARIGRHRAGRRRHHVHLPRRVLQQGIEGAGHRRDHHRQAA